MPIQINLKDVEKWLVLGEKVFRHPATRAVLRPLLPTLGLTEDQMRDLDLRHAGYVARKARAQTRARR